MGNSQPSELSKLSLAQCGRYLVNGYTRNSLQQSDITANYPISINKIIDKYLGNIFLKFDICPNDYTQVIQNDGTLMNRSIDIVENGKLFLVASSTGFSSGINEIKIEVMQDHNNSIIGVITDINHCKRKIWIGYIKANMYYYFGGDMDGSGTCITQKVNGKRHFEPVVEDHAWKKNDIITIKIDCEQWKIRFFRNNQIVGNELNIIKGFTYYPVISTSGAGAFRIC